MQYCKNIYFLSEADVIPGLYDPLELILDFCFEISKETNFIQITYESVTIRVSYLEKVSPFTYQYSIQANQSYGTVAKQKTFRTRK